VLRNFAQTIPDFINGIGHKQTGRHDLGQVRFTPQSGHARANLDTSA